MARLDECTQNSESNGCPPLISINLYLTLVFDEDLYAVMTQAFEITSIEYNLWDGVNQRANHCYRNKLSNLEKTVKVGEDSLAELCQRHQEDNAKVGKMDAQLSIIVRRLNEAQAKIS
ncbi:hypothetical protein J1N35_000994 [Gossypium stocksii]|uniref:Uncharacterized protein n=1 Tax=Gossypium stocksii TaxID=47602 RepID=A0A9D4AKY5_9ROSI|nr:hypothetical protein J1N35_000994 [Gossypium stocksii]